MNTLLYVLATIAGMLAIFGAYVYTEHEKFWGSCLFICVGLLAFTHPAF